ncbi:hypothetical protein ABTX81_23860 [Kitasatospora sp. NPDC097605]|uniref:hypothetical protein n=1 Tax=Kitasatospora sp. NPDC097605 TaxID=3157226 RepID=UPI0033300662
MSGNAAGRPRWYTRTWHAVREIIGLRPPRSAWRERVLARIGYLRVLLDRETCATPPGVDTECPRRVLVDGARIRLDNAAAAAVERFHWRRPWSGATALEGAWANVRAADVLLLELVPTALLPDRAIDILALARNHLGRKDLRTVALAKRVGSANIGEPDRNLLIRTLDAAYAALDAEYARVRSLRNMLWAATLCVLVGVAGLAVYGWFNPTSLSLCFSPAPPATPEPGATRLVVCPSGEFVWGTKGVIAGNYATSGDIITVEVAGLAGAALTVIGSLRRIQGTSAPFMLPLAAAALKFPTGALSALIGLLLIRGAFVPGLSDLDSRAQVLAWGVAFGAAQHLVTRMVDERAQSTLKEVGRPPGGDVAPEDATGGAAARPES